MGSISGVIPTAIAIANMIAPFQSLLTAPCTINTAGAMTCKGAIVCVCINWKAEREKIWTDRHETQKDVANFLDADLDSVFRPFLVELLSDGSHVCVLSSRDHDCTTVPSCDRCTRQADIMIIQEMERLRLVHSGGADDLVDRQHLSCERRLRNGQGLSRDDNTVPREYVTTCKTVRF